MPAPSEAWLFLIGHTSELIVLFAKVVYESFSWFALSRRAPYHRCNRQEPGEHVSGHAAIYLEWLTMKDP